MIKLLSTIGALAGIAFLAFAFLDPPSMGASQAREGAAGCRNVDVRLDEGYGVSQIETRVVCGR